MYGTGYDMQFDIKYAYFNFLQSIPHSSIEDAKLPNAERKEESEFEDFSCSLREWIVCWTILIKFTRGQYELCLYFT